MKKVAMTVLGVVSIAGSANAGGTWYTSHATWLSLISNTVSTADYNSFSGKVNAPYLESGVTAEASGGVFGSGGYLTNFVSLRPITFTFSGNAFSGEFRMTEYGLGNVAPIVFTVDGSLTDVYTLPSSATAYTFLGYISDSASPISVVASGGSGDQNIQVNSFSFGNGTNPLGGGNVAPEPGTLALALTGGCALVGMFIRRRKAA